MPFDDQFWRAVSTNGASTLAVFCERYARWDDAIARGSVLNQVSDTRLVADFDNSIFPLHRPTNVVRRASDLQVSSGARVFNANDQDRVRNGEAPKSRVTTLPPAEQGWKMPQRVGDTLFLRHFVPMRLRCPLWSQHATTALVVFRVGRIG